MITDDQLKAARKSHYDAMREAERDKLPIEARADFALRAALETVAPYPMNIIEGKPCTPVICRTLKPGELLPFEWWDATAGRWARGDAVPTALLDALPGGERERVERHAWRWLGMQAEAAHP